VKAPGAANSPDIAISHRDRFYTSDQFSNTVSVIDPADNKLLGAIHLGDPTPGNLSPLYRGQLLVHGMGFSPDHRTLAVVSIGSNSVTFIDTATNAIKHVAYVGRAPHEAFFTPDGKEIWVSIRGENYVAVLDGNTFKEKTRITVPNGPVLAALRGGIKTVLIPEENAKDLVEIADSIKSGLEIVPVSRMDEVLARAMTRKPEPIEWDETTTTAAAVPEEAPVEEEAATLTAH
jgi:YVTN family beta-propeller protein